MRPISILCAFVLASLSASPDALSQRRSLPKMIDGVDVIDVVKGEVLEDQSVLIENGKITSVTPTGMLLPKDGVPVIDGRGAYLLPGLVDAHVHYLDPETFGPLLIAHGVTHVRDMGGFTDEIASLRGELERGELLGPQMTITGAILDGAEPVWPYSIPCATPQDGKAAVQELARYRVDQIKVYALLEAEVYDAIIDEAQRRGLRVVGHVPASITLEHAMISGQGSIEHLTGFEAFLIDLASRESLETASNAWELYRKRDKKQWSAMLHRLANAKVAQCPTLASVDALIRSRSATDQEIATEYLPLSLRAYWDSKIDEDRVQGLRGILEPMKKVVKDLYDHGVPLLCGTDLGQPYLVAGASLHREMELFQDAGIPAAAILRFATIDAATFCGRDDRMGTITPGKEANLVLLRENPLEDVRHLQSIERVYLRGWEYQRKHLDELLKGVKIFIAQEGRPQIPDVEDASPLEAPGELLIEGRYLSHAGTTPLGHEEFIISETDEAYHLEAATTSRATGATNRLSYTLGKDLEFLRAEWTQPGDLDNRATYSVLNETLIARGADGKESRLPFAKGTLVSGPAQMLDFVILKTTRLEVGQESKRLGYMFGSKGWEPVPYHVTLTRREDQRLTVGDGSVSARYYTTLFEVEDLEYRGEMWCDERGVLLRARTKFPAGTVDVWLQ